MIVELHNRMASHSQNPTLDTLYCQEERFAEDWDDGLQIRDFDNAHKRGSQLGTDLCWEEEELATLLSKEAKQEPLDYSDVVLRMGRHEAVKWMMKVIARHGFAALTGVLAANYYDRFFITRLCFPTDKPWMSQLAAVACLSIAAKVEEKQVPLLLDFQVEDCKYVFDAKPIQRMELLVLSTLQWRMNPVTPISFLDHIVRRFELLSVLHWEFVKRCEIILLAVVADADCRLAGYLPSVVAAATMIHVIRETETCVVAEYEDQFIGALRDDEGIIDDCRKLIVEIVGDSIYGLCHKRKHEAMPRSPSGVIDAYLSSDSSSESWSVSPSASSSPEPVVKRVRGA